MLPNRTLTKCGRGSGRLRPAPQLHEQGRAPSGHVDVGGQAPPPIEAADPRRRPRHPPRRRGRGGESDEVALERSRLDGDRGAGLYDGDAAKRVSTGGTFEACDTARFPRGGRVGHECAGSAIAREAGWQATLAAAASGRRASGRAGRRRRAKHDTPPPDTLPNRPAPPFPSVTIIAPSRRADPRREPFDNTERATRISRIDRPDEPANSRFSGARPGTRSAGIAPRGAILPDPQHAPEKASNGTKGQTIERAIERVNEGPTGQHRRSSGTCFREVDPRT